LLRSEKGLTWTTLNATYINQTVTADHWWSLQFSAITDPDGDGNFQPLYFNTGLGEDLASFKVYWNDTRTLITEIGADSNGYATQLFNISDTIVEFSEIGTGCFLANMKPTELYKEVVWNLFVNKGEYTPITVGAETLKLDNATKTVYVYNATPIGGAISTTPIYSTGLVTSSTTQTIVPDYAYTRYFRVNILDPCGSPIDTGALDAWKVFFQAKLDNRNVILRSGTPKGSTAPSIGATAGDGLPAFWIPDITKIYGKSYNVTLNIEYYHVQVFTAVFPTNATSLTLSDNLGTYMKNIGTAVDLTFPVGDLNVTLTMWDIKYPIYNLTVWIEYLKDGKVVFTEDTKLTDCYGKVTFTQVPLLPAETGRKYAIRIVAMTSNSTPYIRRLVQNAPDVGLVVANYTFNITAAFPKVTWTLAEPNLGWTFELSVACSNEIILPTWIYSFKVIAVDHAGNVLERMKTDVGTYEVAVLLNDTTYTDEKTCCPDICPAPGCICPPPGIVTVDFKILNQTTKDNPKAIFYYYSQQYYDSDPDKDTLPILPHMFVAGAKYHFMVFHGGVLVYNYTITLPKPYETKTILFNETTMETEEVDKATFDYTWLADGKGSIKHPIMVFTGAKSWRDTGKRADAELKLVTWVQTLEVTTLTNAGKFTVPSLNLTLIRTDALNWTIVGGDYDTLSDPTAWSDKWTSYAWSAVGGADGTIRIQVPVWVPSRATVAARPHNCPRRRRRDCQR
jgi:hypothetical protein